MQGLLNLFADDNGNNSIIAELIPQTTAETDVIGACRNGFHIAFGVAASGQIKLIALVG